MIKTDIVIIGAGMAGISAAVYLKRANADFILLEGNMPGGMLNNLKKVDNYPTMPNTTGQDILLSLMDQLKFNNIDITYGNVQTILKENVGFEVVTDVDSYETKTVIVATGITQTSNSIVGEEKYAGMGVSYCATCDGNFFKNETVAVIGNNNICLEEALYLSNLASHLYFVCPDDQLEGDLELTRKLSSKSNVQIILSTKVDEIIGNNFGVTGIKIKDEIIEVSGVFPYIGKKTTSQILNNLNPNKEGIFIKVDEEGMTNIPGLFAAGDIVAKRVKQLVTAAGDGAIAATSADKFCKLK